MTNIQPLYVTLAKLIEGRLFRIPDYQRSYSWGRGQRQDLFNDILTIHAKETSRSHFMATVVGLRRDTTSILAKDHHIIEIVDGQQRITTLILLLKAITKTIDSSNPIEETIGQDVSGSLVKNDKATLLLLQTNHDSSHYFADYLRKGTHPSSKTAKTIADRELLSAMEDCENFVAHWQRDGNSIEDLVSLLNNRLTFVFYEIGDESLVYTVFEVLNSRGLEVSWFDRLKSNLMAIVFDSEEGNNEVIDEIHQLWRQMYECVGLRLGQSTESMVFAATLWTPERPNRTLSPEGAARLLTDRSKRGSEEVIATTQWLREVTVAVDSLAADVRTGTVRRTAQARIVATAVNLRGDFSDDERERILRRWENVTFRIFGMFRKDARWAVGSYIRLAWSIINDELAAKDVLKSLSAIGREFPIAEAVEHIRKTDCYTNWGDDLRYFLFRYEEHLAKKEGQNFENEQWNHIWESTAARSIEHIRAQSRWGSEPDLTKMHSLGNLMMLPPGLNSKLQDKPPKAKAAAYVKTGLLAAQEVADLISDSGWSRKTRRSREDDLLTWAQEVWAD